MKLKIVPKLSSEATGTCWGCVGYGGPCPRDEDRIAAGRHSCCNTDHNGNYVHAVVFIEDTDEGMAKYVMDKLTGEPT